MGSRGYSRQESSEVSIRQVIEKSKRHTVSWSKPNRSRRQTEKKPSSQVVKQSSHQAAFSSTSTLITQPSHQPPPTPSPNSQLSLSHSSHPPTARPPCMHPFLLTSRKTQKPLPNLLTKPTERNPVSTSTKMSRLCPFSLPNFILISYFLFLSPSHPIPISFYLETSLYPPLFSNVHPPFHGNHTPLREGTCFYTEKQISFSSIPGL